MRLVALSSGTGWHVQDLLRAAGALGHELTPCNWRTLRGSVASGAANGPIAEASDGPRTVALDEADAVLLRTMPAGSLEQIVFRMDLIQALHRRGRLVLNEPRAIEIAVDKYLALTRLAAAGVPVPPTAVCQRFADAMEAFESLGRDAVLKPLFGSEGFGITRLTDPDVAARAFATLERLGSVIYLQRFIPHGGADHRLFVLAGRVLASMRRRNARDWRTNIARGGRGEPWTPEPALAKLAVRAAAACETWVAGVDVALDAAAGPVVLEVNAVPGWRELARVTHIDVASALLTEVTSLARSNQESRPVTPIQARP